VDVVDQLRIARALLESVQGPFQRRESRAGLVREDPDEDRPIEAAVAHLQWDRKAVAPT
jgi:hypothetical protein